MSNPSSDDPLEGVDVELEFWKLAAMAWPDIKDEIARQAVENVAVQNVVVPTDPTVDAPHGIPDPLNTDTTAALQPDQKVLLQVLMTRAQAQELITSLEHYWDHACAEGAAYLDRFVAYCVSLLGEALG